MAKETPVISQKTSVRNSLLITKMPHLQLSLASQSVLAPVAMPILSEWRNPWRCSADATAPAAAHAAEGRNQSDHKIRQEVPSDSISLQLRSVRCQQ